MTEVEIESKPVIYTMNVQSGAILALNVRHCVNKLIGLRVTDCSRDD